jgi:hypothetical protein
MLRTYSQYIALYIREKPPRDQRHSGEHHFVATYLLPRLNQVTKRTPYYVNPDGMKRIAGDVVYYSGERLCLSFEVKYNVVRLTTNEFNGGICERKGKDWPTIFIGVCAEGLVILDWREFRRRYLELKYGSRVPKHIRPRSYGRLLDVVRLIEAGGDGIFPFFGDSAAAANRAEVGFRKALHTTAAHVALWS